MQYGNCIKLCAHWDPATSAFAIAGKADKLEYINKQQIAQHHQVCVPHAAVLSCCGMLCPGLVASRDSLLFIP